MADTQHYLASLLTRIAAGDQHAFAIFFDHTYQTVFSWIDPAVAPDARDELVIAAYLQVWVAAPSFPESGCTVTQWLAATTAPALTARPSAQASSTLRIRRRSSRLPWARGRLTKAS